MRYMASHFKLSYKTLRVKKDIYDLWFNLRQKKEKSDEEKRTLNRIRMILKLPVYEIVVKHLKSGTEKIVRVNKPPTQVEIKALLKETCDLYREKKKKALKTPTPVKRDYYGFCMERVAGAYTKPGSIIEAMEKNKKNSPETEKKPHTNINYIGIELEFNTQGQENTERKIINQRLIDKKLGKYCHLVSDGSCGHELRVLLPETDYIEPLQQIMNVLVELGYSCDNRCGTHVHIDMRNRQVDNIYTNLVNVQDLMYKLVRKDRRTNSFCRKNSLNQFKDAIQNGERYQCVNPHSYKKHKTLEVRLHHGTLDFAELNSWLQLVLRIVNFKGQIEAPISKMTELSKTLEFSKDEVLNLKTRYRKYNAKITSIGTVEF